jgi:hypothetical protein
MSNLLINRFMVIAKGKTVYDENFHKGLNIIRGQNGSGKSTIIELIYYVLGADHIDWKEEALKCDYVIAEIEIKNIFISLKREIRAEGIPPLYLFWGKIEDSTIKSWEVYSMKRSIERESFSQIIFRALNIPDSNENVSLTMHQILRMLYIDQLSPANSLMRPEPFDPIAIKEAVSKTLMGAYDIRLLVDENELRKKKNGIEKYEAEIRNIQYIIKENGFNLSIDEVRKKINGNIAQINKIDNNITSLNQEAIKRNENKYDAKINDLFKRMKMAKEKYISLSENISSLNYDIVDSENFIAELRQRTIDLTNSISMRNFLPTLRISYCPICLNPIDPAKEENMCPLCNKNISENDLTLNALRLKNELAFQIKESLIILENKKKTLDKSMTDVSAITKQIYLLQTEVDSYSTVIETTEQQNRDELIFIKGNLSKEVEYLNKELIFQERLKEDVRILGNLKSEISDLEMQINTKRERLNKNYNDAMNLIKKNAIEFIKNDMPRDLPNDDISLSGLNIDFEKNNTFSINRRYNFAASSMAYLKNSIMFAFFFASLKLNSMNYPRFIICDNIEDKGMEAERSHNFQLCLFEKSQQFDQVDHQMIITTSMIEPSLNKDEICIGEYYTNESKSLKFEVE